MDALTQRLTRDPKPLGSAASDVPADLAVAVDRCLQRDVTKRWPDAKSLREALQPSDEESDDSLPGRLLRVGVTFGLLSVLAFAYQSAYSALNPNFRVPFRGIPILVGPIVTMLILGVVGTIGLRSHGLDGRSILRRALQQPRWWRSWYPRAFRRRGDVWNRLPHELRRFRVYRGVYQMYMLGILIPLHMMTFLGRLSMTRLAVVWSIGFVGMAVLLTERRRATRFVRAKVAATAAEASALLTTSTWGVSTWRRAPTSSLLGGQAHTPRRASDAPDAGDTTAESATTHL
jgi:hypothetical protein